MPMRMAMPAAISITPATRISAPAERGTTLRTSGLAYCSQLDNRFRNLSSPARNSISPKAMRRVQKAEVSRVSMRACPPIRFVRRDACWREIRRGSRAFRSLGSERRDRFLHEHERAVVGFRVLPDDVSGDLR